jgi:hypothetical protein
MQITSTKTSAKATRSAASPQEKAFEQAWNRVLRQEQKNATLRAEVRAFSHKVSSAIAAHENACLQAMVQTCLHLLSFCKRKSLTLRQRALLLDWISEYLLSINSNPFSAGMDLRALHQGVEEQLDQLELEELEQSDMYQAETDEESAEAPEVDDMFADFFGDFAGTANADDQDFDPFAETLFDDFAQQHEAVDERAAEAQTVQDLMKDSSVNKLFRKLARVLHPDRERDEDARKDKNRLMSELLQARESKDIPTIFSLYAKHVGESPLQELADDLEGVTRLLQRRYEDLRGQKDSIIEEDPLAGALYRCFHRKSEPAVQRAIRDHQAELQAHAQELQLLCADLRNLSTLKRYLAQRRREIDMDDFIFDL